MSRPRRLYHPADPWPPVEQPSQDEWGFALHGFEAVAFFIGATAILLLFALVVTHG